MSVDTLRPNEVVITEANAINWTNPRIGDEVKYCGTIPQPDGWRGAFQRDMRAVPLDLIPESEWAERIREKVEAKSQLSDIWRRKNVPILDQNGKGYCWAHSGTSAVQAIRAAMNLPTVGLSAYAVACIIKGYRDQGGWGAQGLDFICERGVPSEDFWPQRSMSSANDKPETWANAALHKVVEWYAQMERPQYDRQLSRQQVATCLLNNIPVIVDYNWWGHSVCALDLVILPSGKFGVRIANSWGTSWSDQGMGVLDDTKAWPDGATAPYGTIASSK